VDAAPVAGVPVPPGGSDLCFVWPGPISAAEHHLRRHGIEVEMGPVECRGAGGVGKSVYFGTPTARSWNSSRTRTLEAVGGGEEKSITDVEHISRKGTGVPVTP
jgi:hypothetical protein